ncbi:MAG: tRNA (adenosine(37)-N6)-threonylcarbamoyltransferase complex ATPase subunit type 1 TsaE [Patescibacteria group bacterium]
MRKTLSKIEQTDKIAGDLARKILLDNNEGAFVVALEGDLGAGKTTFAQGFARALGIKEKITSPTFVLLKKYKINSDRYGSLIHIDAYRLEDPQDLIELGWDKLVLDPKNIILVEWADKIKKILPKKHILIKLMHSSNQTRQIGVYY